MYRDAGCKAACIAAYSARIQDLSLEARTYFNIPHGREAVFAGWTARREERNVVVPPERRTTLQTARKGASPTAFDASARATLLRALRMRYGHSTRRAARIRANASETRLMRNTEIGLR